MDPPAREPRPATPLPESVAARYAVPGPVEEEVLFPLGGDGALRFFGGRVRSGEERAEFWLVRPDGDSPRPFVLCLPILAGGENLMWIVATDLAERGYAVAWTRRIAPALAVEHSPADLELLCRRTIVHNRIVLAWARTQPEIDADRIGLLGISLGGMVGAALLACEPTILGGALCLAGGDLPDIVRHSTERRVVRWRTARWERQSLGDSELERQLRLRLVTDPVRLAAHVDTRRVFLVAARFDSVVPWHNQQILWEAFGRPRRLCLPLGHYSSALALGAVLGAVHAFLESRFLAPG